MPLEISLKTSLNLLPKLILFFSSLYFCSSEAICAQVKK